jgi:hypothetical protein
MGAFRKKIRSEVSRSARMVVEQYYKSHGIQKKSADIERMVKAAEVEIVPMIMEELKNRDSRSTDSEASAD